MQCSSIYWRRWKDERNIFYKEALEYEELGEERVYLLVFQYFLTAFLEFFK
jgi:hypothetical protein